MAESQTICWVAQIPFSHFFLMNNFHFLVHILEEKVDYNLVLLFGYKRESNFKFFPFARANFLSDLCLILREKMFVLKRKC